MKQRQLLSRRATFRGFAMLEALVGLLIFSFGILGLVGLQASMTKAQTVSRARSDAAALAADLVGAMWSDVPHLSSYGSNNCENYAPCKSWAAKVEATLPAGSPTVAVNNGLVTITLSWTMPGESMPNRYVTSTAIRI